MPDDRRPDENDRSRDELMAKEENSRVGTPPENGSTEDTYPQPSGQREVVSLAEEQVRVNRRKVETGRVRVSTKVGTREEEIDVELMKDEVEVRRVPVGREVDGPVPIRQQGDVTIVPLVEEVVIVRKQLVLREEVHIRKLSIRRRESERVELRYEEPVIERLPVDEDGSE